MTDIGLLAQEFGRHFGGTPQFFRAPGRVNLIGEFTDYNAGFVLPAAIPFYTTVGVAARSGGRLRVHSTNLKETREINLNLLRVPGARPSGRHWSDYVAGVAWALEAHGVILDGADLLIHGEVPLGAGLSSSAALEVAVVLALASLADVALDGFAVAKIAQRAENDYVGMQCGIMDPFTSVFGKWGMRSRSIAGRSRMSWCRWRGSRRGARRRGS
jgi:galactokinase